MPLFIYTDSIEKNVDEIRKYTNRKIIAVMKSNAYELGSKKIIPILRKKGVDFFAFEKCKEYFENIEVCKNTNVLIMESIPTNKILKINNKNVRISINSCLDAFYIRNLEIPLKVHLRIDSGMNRLGLQTIDEVKWVLNILKKNKNIEIEGIYTHFYVKRIIVFYAIFYVGTIYDITDVYRMLFGITTVLLMCAIGFYEKNLAVINFPVRITKDYGTTKYDRNRTIENNVIGGKLLLIGIVLSIPAILYACNEVARNVFYVLQMFEILGLVLYVLMAKRNLEIKMEEKHWMIQLFDEDDGI